MKKVLALLMALVLALSFAACSAKTDSGESSAYDYAFWGDPLLYTK